MKKKPKQKKSKKGKSPYVHFGPPEGDPRPENRIFIKCKSLTDIHRKVDTFTFLAVKEGATIIQIKAPGRSAKEGHAELYSDAGIDKKKLKSPMGFLRKIFTR